MEDICKQFGQNVRKYREKKDFLKKNWLRTSGLHRTYISAVERGTRSISLSNIKKISDALEIEIYKLFLFEEGNVDEKMD
ncbi:helix-turn-helix transcriptional regulator [Bacillus smithii]|uniref:helix-turn-helix domain-containing protein n=1 Tax=Bacillus smithii TaxID=1479 RepID=UPI002E1C9DA4|nr:helix-turn-helix transcriptional regulator [Bacillus smithii]